MVLVDKLNKDKHKGDNFSVSFENETSLEMAAGLISKEFEVFFMQKTGLEIVENKVYVSQQNSTRNMLVQRNENLKSNGCVSYSVREDRMYTGMLERFHSYLSQRFRP